MKTMRIILFTLLLATLTPLVMGSVINVPADYPTIQAGVDAAVNGDTVLVDQGSYTEQVDLRGKSLTIEGQPYVYINCVGIAFIADDCSNVTIRNFRMFFGDGYNGGAIYCSSSELLLDNCEFRDCQAEQDGGAVYIWNSIAVLNHCYFEDCSAGWYGGALSARNSEVEIYNSQFYENTATQVGGTISIGMESSATIKDTLIFGGTAVSGAGIAIWDCGLGEILIAGCDIVQNEAVDFGGGVYINSASPSFVGNFIGGNDLTANGSKGGGIYCYNASPIFVGGELIENAATFGSALRAENCPSWICFHDYKVCENNSDNGTFSFLNSSLEMASCLVSNNEQVVLGGTLNMSSSNLIMRFCTFTANDVNEWDGASIFSADSNIEITDSIFWNNGETGEEIHVYSGSDPLVSYSCIRGGYGGTGNISNDPMLVESGYEYRLDPNSLCVDAGSQLAEDALFVSSERKYRMSHMVSTTDSLVDTGTVDMGCHYVDITNYHGDVNFSGEVTAEDAQLAFQIALGVVEYDYPQFLAADWNQNGVVTAGDCQSIFQEALGF